LPASAIYMFASRFEEPSLEEGFEEIVKVDFRFRGTKEEEEVWRMWWD
jgi:bifunctional polynucleotide phosphatase/kinase